MTAIPQFSPGCFGSAIAFKKNDVACGSCPFAAQCEPAHLEAQKELRSKYNVRTTVETTLAKKEAKEAQKSEPVDPAALALPVKTQELITRLDRGNYNVIANLQRGVNPFGAAIPFMMLACHFLLRLDRPISARGLTVAYVNKFGWKENTAKAHARMAVQALTHIGAVDNIDGMMTIRRG